MELPIRVADHRLLREFTVFDQATMAAFAWTDDPARMSIVLGSTWTANRIASMGRRRPIQ